MNKMEDTPEETAQRKEERKAELQAALDNAALKAQEEQIQRENIKIAFQILKDKPK